MSNKSDIKLSKALSWILRHGAVKEGLTLSPEGYTPVANLLQHRLFKGQYKITDIERVVETNDKQRFKLRVNPLTHALEIRANQGHSLSGVSEGLTPILEAKYPTVVHGTYLNCYKSIKKQGLSRMSRQHIHFAKGTPGDKSVISGLRRDTEVFIYLDLQKALDDGLKFFESENGVILTAGNKDGYILPKYFLKVTSNSGYPNYALTQDLLRAFARVVRVKVERMTDHFAVLICANAQDVETAVEASNTIHVYGSFLTIRKFTKEYQKPPGRQFNLSIIVEPKDIDLTGDFFAQAAAVLARVRLTQGEVERISTLYADVEAALSSVWPGCVAMPFGSITTGLGIKTSDADCFVDLPPRFHYPQANHVNKARRLLQQYPANFAEILAIPRANTPIVKFYHIPTATNCDLSFKTPLGAQNSKLITFLLHADPKLIPIAVIIKYWAKVHELSGTGRLSNYALTMLLIFYLQQPPMSILPSVEWLQRDAENDYIVDGWNTGFMNKRDLIPPTTNTSSIAELLGGFFEFYANFNFHELVVCPFMGKPIKKQWFKEPELLPPEYARYCKNVTDEIAYPMRVTTSFCVQDPFELSHNVASSVGSRLADDIVAYFKFAANAYETEKLNNCQNFLKTILLQRPKLNKGRVQREFRFSMFPKYFEALKDPDWKGTVRMVVLSVFEKILKLQLGKIEEKTNPEQKKEKEKYWTIMRHPVWRRRNVSKELKNAKMEFLEKEMKITEEILAKDTAPIEMEFQVIMTYSEDPRIATVTVKLSNAPLELFVEFGRFFISTMPTWAMNLLKPQTKKPVVIPGLEKGDAGNNSKDNTGMAKGDAKDAAQSKSDEDELSKTNGDKNGDDREKNDTVTESGEKVTDTNSSDAKTSAENVKEVTSDDVKDVNAEIVKDVNDEILKDENAEIVKDNSNIDSATTEMIALSI